MLSGPSWGSGWAWDTQDTVAYSGRQADHPQMLWLPRGASREVAFWLSEAGGPPLSLLPGIVVQTEEKEPVSGHQSNSNQSNWHIIQNNGGFVRRLQQAEQSWLKSLLSPPIPTLCARDFETLR